MRNTERHRGNRVRTVVGGSSKAFQKIALVAAVGFVLGVGHSAQAHTDNGKIAGTCTVDDQSGRGTVTVSITNVWNQAVRNVKPDDLFGSRTGTAELYVQTFPSPLRQLLPGKSADFQWRGRLYGDGLLDLSVVVNAEADDGTSETTGILNCNRVTVGSGGPEPSDTPAGDPTATASAPPAPTNTARPTRTLAPTRTVRALPTATPTRVPPTRTPVVGRPTRTPNDPPTRTPTRVIPTRVATSTQPIRPTSTATATRQPPTAPPPPTRTPMPPATPRPTRTPNNQPSPTATVSRPIALLDASCSLRRNVDFVTVTMVVENSLGSNVSGLRASSLQLEPEGGALFFDRTGPSPNLVSSLQPGVSATFQWTGRLSAGGTMGFSATASGSTAAGPVQTRLIDCGVAGMGDGGFDPADFSGTCVIHPGDPGTMTVELRNGTAEPLTKVEAFFSSKSATGTATVNEMQGPAPRSVSTMGTGVRRDFDFAARFLGTGNVTLHFEGKANRSTYDRISTGDIVCTAQTSPAPGDLPDLGVDQDNLRDSAYISTENFPADHCAVVEGCVDGTGNRKLLRFDTTTPNYGPGDVFLGDPRGSSEFVYSACHNHYHFQEYADYRLLDLAGNIVARGHKQAFCLVDLWRPPGLRGDAAPQFTNCGFQGISAGWADVYNSGLDCQWIDITAVPSGRYVLEVEINPAHVIQEHDYSNNTARTEITIP